MKQVFSFSVVLLSAFVLTNGVAKGQSNDQPFELIEDLSGNVLITDSDVFEILSRSSLMLTSAQKPQIEAAKQIALDLMAQRDSLSDIQENADFAEALETREFVLDAIMYLGPVTWTIWINGEAFKPDRIPEDVRVVSVSPGSAEIVWFADPENPSDVHEFKLLPGQVYLADTGEVLEASQRNIGKQGGEDADDESERPERNADDEAAPQDLDPSEAQAQQLEALKDALELIPEGVLPDDQAAEFEALQDALNSGGEGGLSDDQIEQLEAIQSLINGGG